jgi:CMP-N-acetylneuraminic acid synthetase
LLDKLNRDEAYSPVYILLLQPTSPLRLETDIDKALELMFKRRADAIVSVCGTEQLLFTKNDHDRLILLSNKNFLSSTNRQQLPPTYKLDGSMIYGIKTSVFLKRRSFLSGKLVGYVIPRWRAVDLDEPEDYVVGEIIFKNFLLINKKIKNFK